MSTEMVMRLVGEWKALVWASRQWLLVRPIVKCELCGKEWVPANLISQGCCLCVWCLDDVSFNAPDDWNPDQMELPFQG